MKSVLKKISQGLLLVPALVMGLSFVAPAVANAACDPNNLTVSSGADCAGSNSGTPTTLFGDTGIFQKIVNIMLFIVGAVAVIMLIIGGIRYVTSNGAQDQVTGAKNTIMYAIIGIIVAVLAYAIVNFVVTGLNK
jgi:Type IV secretion system pilin